MPNIVDAVFNMDEEHDACDDKGEHANGAEAEIEGSFEAFGEEFCDDITSNWCNELVNPCDELGDVDLFVKGNHEAAADDHERDKCEHGRVGAACNARKHTQAADFRVEYGKKGCSGVKASTVPRFLLHAGEKVLFSLWSDLFDELFRIEHFTGLAESVELR